MNVDKHMAQGAAPLQQTLEHAKTPKDVQWVIDLSTTTALYAQVTKGLRACARHGDHGDGNDGGKILASNVATLHKHHASTVEKDSTFRPVHLTTSDAQALQKLAAMWAKVAKVLVAFCAGADTGKTGEARLVRMISQTLRGVAKFAQRFRSKAPKRTRVKAGETHHMALYVLSYAFTYTVPLMALHALGSEAAMRDMDKIVGANPAMRIPFSSFGMDNGVLAFMNLVTNGDMVKNAIRTMGRTTSPAGLDGGFHSVYERFRLPQWMEILAPSLEGVTFESPQAATQEFLKAMKSGVRPGLQKIGQGALDAASGLAQTTSDAAKSVHQFASDTISGNWQPEPNLDKNDFLWKAFAKHKEAEALRLQPFPLTELQAAKSTAAKAAMTKAAKAVAAEAAAAKAATAKAVEAAATKAAKHAAKAAAAEAAKQARNPVSMLSHFYDVSPTSPKDLGKVQEAVSSQVGKVNQHIRDTIHNLKMEGIPHATVQKRWINNLKDLQQDHRALYKNPWEADGLVYRIQEQAKEMLQKEHAKRNLRTLYFGQAAENLSNKENPWLKYDKQNWWLKELQGEDWLHPTGQSPAKNISFRNHFVHQMVGNGVMGHVMANIAFDLMASIARSLIIQALFRAIEWVMTKIGLGKWIPWMRWARTWYARIDLSIAVFQTFTANAWGASTLSGLSGLSLAPLGLAALIALILSVIAMAAMFTIMYLKQRNGRTKASRASVRRIQGMKARTWSQRFIFGS